MAARTPEVVLPAPIEPEATRAPDPAPSADIPKPLPSTPPSTAERDDAAVLAEARAGVHEVSPTEHSITHHAWDLLWQHTGLVFGRGTIRPVPGHGGAKTQLLFKDLPVDSPAGWLGFRDGDALLEVAGRDVTSPERALEAYAATHKLDTIPCVVIRSGKRVTLTVHIVDSP